MGFMSALKIAVWVVMLIGTIAMAVVWVSDRLGNAAGAIVGAVLLILGTAFSVLLFS